MNRAPINLAWALPVLLLGTLSLQGQDATVIHNTSGSALAVTMSPRGAGQVEFRTQGNQKALCALPGGTPCTVPAKAYIEFSFVPDPKVEFFSRDIKFTEAGENGGWAWFRISQPKGKRLEIQKAGSALTQVAYNLDPDNQNFTFIPAKTTSALTAEKVGLFNGSKVPLKFLLKPGSQGEADKRAFASISRPSENSDIPIMSEGFLKVGSAKTIVSVTVADPSFSYEIWISDAKSFSDVYANLKA